MERRAEPGDGAIAIVGMAFRFPGGCADETSFWQALVDQQDLVTQVPAERWALDELQHARRSEPGRSVTFAAGVVDHVDAFDAAFFNISPREAAWLDPQQRLLLELSWEAFENAGIRPSTLAGTDCAVYVGISSLDYGTRGLDDLASLSAHSMTGNTLSVVANRLSYFYDLRGPSLAVDTACSSSLVALHQACRALQTGEAGSALVGGVSLLLHPYPFIGFTKASMLSATGRCRPFDAAGDGYVRAEGGAILMLKPYARALADGDTIRAVILASGTNTDGARKPGLTIPSSTAQAELMRAVLARSGLGADEVDFVEAHGTGTPVGDPIEAQALGAVYGRLRTEPLPIGSVKANLGHMEAAAGMAGLVKTVLALEHGVLPGLLHLETPNPHIDFEGLNLRLTARNLPLGPAESGRALAAGVSAFGFGGANAHILLQAAPLASRLSHAAAPAVAPRRTALSALPPLFISAHDEAALRALAGRWAEQFAGQDQAACYDLAWSAAFHRERLARRLVLQVDACAQADDALRRFAAGENPRELVCEDALPGGDQIAFVYSGNGAQWQGMGCRLLAESPRFAQIMAGLDAVMRPLAGFSLLDELRASSADSRLADTEVAQPLLFAIQVAVTTLLREHDVRPTAVTGHSVGEIAAAWASGALDLQQAMHLVCARSRAQGLTRGHGRMAVVALDAETLHSVLARFAGDARIEIAAFNSPRNLTLSGSGEDLERLRKDLRSTGTTAHLLDLDYAFHSEQMEPVRGLLLRDLADLRPGAATQAQFVSAVSGELADGTSLDARYWWRNVREPVRFVAAVSRLAQLGCRSFIEIGPHAILQRYLNETLAASQARCRVLATARRYDDGLAALRQAVGRAWLLADEARLQAVFPVPGRRVRLPAYPWQRERHWHARTVECLGAISRERVHPLLGWPQAGSSTAWENTLDEAVLPWLADHRVGGAIVFPAAGFAEMAVAAAREVYGGPSWLVEGLDILAPLVLQGDQACALRLDLNPRDGNIMIRSRERLSDADWTVHATARVVEGSGYQPLPRIVTTPADAWRIDHDRHYELAASVGLDYGTAFRSVRGARLDGDVLEAELQAASDIGGDYLLHPGLLDGAFQTLIDLYAQRIDAGERKALLPVRIGRLLRLADGAPARVRTRLARRSARSVLADFELLRADGTLCMRLDACRFRAVALDASSLAPVSHWRIELQPLPHPHDLRVRELPPLAELLEAASASLAALDPERTRWFRETLPLREILVLAFAREACQKLAQERGAGWLQLLDGPEASPFARWIAALLRQEQILVAGQGDEWGFAREVDLPSADEIWQNLVREQSGSVGWLARVARWGEALPGVLAGEADASGLLAELRGSPLVDGLYRDDPDHLGVRLALPAIVQSIVARAPAARLRVLECTLDTDGAGRALVAALPAGQHDCVLAVGNAQLETGACIEHGDRAAIEVAACDPRAAQPLPATGAEHLDLIIFHHSLHALADPLAALAQARERLAPGGLLIVVERHPDWTAQFLDGLDPSWWLELPASDGIPQPAPVPPLLCPDAWQGLLEESGFESCVAWKEAAARDLAEGAFLVLASAPRPECERAGLALPDGQAHAEAASWVLLADPAGMACAERLREQLEARGERVRIGAHWPAEVAPEASEAPAHVVSLRGWNDGPADAAARVAELAMLAQRLTDEPAPARLWVVTRGGALAGELPATVVPNPTQAALWGLGRVLMNEVPVLACTLIELGLPEGSDEVARLARELLAPDGAREIVSLPQGRQVLVLREADAVDTRSVGRAGRFRLDFDVPGQLQRLRWRETAEQPLAAGEVEVRTQAAGLNFRDVMYLMGLLPDEAVEDGFAGASLGLECAGVVRRVGPEVHGLRVGDTVMGFGSACFASHVVTRADALLRIPAGWSCAAAATVPTAFFTAYYALSHLAGLQQGERVLIHGAAGGVGMAAIQLARHRGAEIFATAGTADKRAFVRLLGADHVLDSRSLAFADEIMARTEGKGVDVVLNSLAGEAMRRSIDLLKPFGRFLELGKRDFFENTPLGLRPFRRNISYFGIDADQLLTVQPALAARLLGEVMVLFDQGVLSPLPCRSFAADQVVDAFRVMQQARHIGKLVIDLDGTAPALVAARKEPAAFRLDEGTWVVSGGLGGFGLASARWLADQGVRELALLGRRGLETPGAAQLVAEFAARGVRVCIHACDVSEAAAVELALAEIRRQQPPLAGVLHAAAVYEDRLLADVDLASVRRVLAAKLQGAWNLHDATRADALRHFVLYGSIATAIGNPGQGAYVAASAGVESLAALRAQLGLPVRCISWGPIGDVGYLARQAGVRTSLAQRLGREPIAARQALAELGPVLQGGTALNIVADFDWHTLARLLPSADSHRFAWLGRRASAETGTASDIRALLREKSADEAQQIVSDLVRQAVAQTLSLAPERIAADQSLAEMGMDSLMAVELVLGIEARFGVRLPVMSLGDAASVASIAQRILQGIVEGGGAPEDDIAPAGGGVDDRIAVGMAARHGEVLSPAQLQSFQADARDLARAEAGAVQ